jgi:MYXO-CTERM domain-containing protein
MQKIKGPPWIATGMLAASLLLPVPLTLAQTTNPTSQTRVVETRTEHDRTGLWGLLGLAGLLGLTGLGRRREDVRVSTDPRERTHT